MADPALPWSTLDSPRFGQLRGVRVSATARYDFWWAIDDGRSPLLILRLEQSRTAADLLLPSLAGIDVEFRDSSPGGELTFRLLDRANAEMFHQLCLDIVVASESAPDERRALEAALGRTWRWHFLLTRGKSRLLSEGEQKGLIGELLTLRDLLVPEIGVAAAAMAWKGPEGAPKDFELGTTCIESKARRGAASARIEISSGDQLDTTHIDTLFLGVTDLHRAVTPEQRGMTVTEVAESVLSACVEPQLLDTYQLIMARLNARGLRMEDDYSAYVWIEGKTSWYHVDEGFPRIQSSHLAAGIEHVRYQVSLGEIEAFKVDRPEIIGRIHGVGVDGPA